MDIVFGWGGGGGEEWGSGWGRGGGRSKQDISNYSILLCSIGARAVSSGGPKKRFSYAKSSVLSQLNTR